MEQIERIIRENGLVTILGELFVCIALTVGGVMAPGFINLIFGG